jgi:hypothetical protein
MAHYAFLDENNVVTNVIVGKDEGTFDWEIYYSMKVGQVCKRTSYNTHGGVHVASSVPFRKNFAGIGYKYDTQRDAFIPPKPFASWMLNEDTCLWDAPVTIPSDVGTGEPPKRYQWNEATVSWVEVKTIES